IESPLAQRMERLWMSLLMMVASSSGFRRALLAANGSAIEADWSRRKMKHPGFLRLISALYMLAPRFRLLRASFDLDLVGLDLLGRDQHLALLRRDVDLALPGRDVDLVASLDVRDERFHLDDRGNGRPQLLAERPVAEEPADQPQRDERDPRVKQLERSTNPRSSARRTRGARSPLRKPGQTTCAALQEASRQHRVVPATLVRLLAPSTARLAHIRSYCERVCRARSPE